MILPCSNCKYCDLDIDEEPCKFCLDANGNLTKFVSKYDVVGEHRHECNDDYCEIQFEEE